MPNIVFTGREMRMDQMVAIGVALGLCLALQVRWIVGEVVRRPGRPCRPLPALQATCLLRILPLAQACAPPHSLSSVVDM